ncbi:MAG: TraR/DksA C4-type zinc finger protein [Proteobacteria bacterium]|jgi:DnaK suppressor protein|nr:TraR/DksA C4-type zinc finger protein [Pseudomonadota bacterium]MBK9251649.1 TraR/DksA C4-type zinc finger protein [Pseudomonadota bacterium]MCC6630950.1 TraR/DksA C4-type zinc finger protein [Gammaproteobacteria bacterium]
MYNTESHRASLRARRDIVKSEIFSALGRINDDRHAALADQVHDTKDHAIAQLLLESDNAELRRAALDLQDIDAALQRVSAGSYGRCLACGTDIPATRLGAYPTAKRCLPCQQEHEKNR